MSTQVFLGAGLRPLSIPHATYTAESERPLWPHTIFPDGVLNEGYLAAPSDADETRAAAEIATTTARMRLKLRGYIVSSCSIERRIGGTGQAAAKRRQS